MKVKVIKCHPSLAYKKDAEFEMDKTVADKLIKSGHLEAKKEVKKEATKPAFKK